ncbi:unnamed protein product [Brugia pahangi]|uniref:alpha-1,6-mannosyl-glycoprotein 6-beta-N-acetylglucosaminyltransferase n=1 Tax=Brugia pahangi TaxID=6280 RepID=A0A0N4TLN8_BRUPA|nr:unnamed protein product [Brugia pahangi]
MARSNQDSSHRSVIILSVISVMVTPLTQVIHCVYHLQLITDLEKQECSISEADAVEYSNCREKMQWMEKEWRTHKCYAFYGVNGTSYLSEVEKYCPMKRILSGLLKLMFDNELNYKFIRTRITLLWPKWLSAYNELMIKWPKVVSLQRKLNVRGQISLLIFLLSELSFLSSTGGPLGELVQWSDLIAALYLLGHNLMISTEVRTLKKNIKKIDDICPCPLHDREVINLLFTDIVGLKYLRGKMKDFFNRMKCKLRILDSFGTHAEFNSRIYFAAHKNLLGGSRKNPWGNHQLDLQQFMTMYPHTDDNTFLGFVMEMDPVKQDIKKNNITLIYGKAGYIFDRSRITCFNEKGEDIFGLGFLFEGPAPLEAIANGVVFISPSFNPPKSRKTSDFFKDKPTFKILMRNFLSVDPHVFTNSSQVEDAIREALLPQPIAYTPFEFTVLGMLQRVSILISKQDFCYVSRFPPVHAMITVEAVSVQSCQEACHQHNFLCERSFFRIVNMPEFLNNGSCATLNSIPIPYAPYECSKQENSDLYSCASVPTILDIRRICPCRDFLQGQTALCSSCL